MDGVGGLSQPHIQPGETFVYEFVLRQHGTHMYHPHADEMTQMAFGMMGMFIIHPKVPRERSPDRDIACSRITGRSILAPIVPILVCCKTSIYGLSIARCSQRLIRWSRQPVSE